jgi:hypothetical protein
MPLLSQHIMRLLMMYCPSVLSPFLLLKPQYLPHHTLPVCFPLWETKFHTHVKRRIIPQVLLYILRSAFLYSLIARMTACHIARIAETRERNCHRVKHEGSKNPKPFSLYKVHISHRKPQTGPRLSLNVIVRYAVCLGERDIWSGVTCSAPNDYH